MTRFQRGGLGSGGAAKSSRFASDSLLLNMARTQHAVLLCDIGIWRLPPDCLWRSASPRKIIIRGIWRRDRTSASHSAQSGHALYQGPGMFVMGQCTAKNRNRFELHVAVDKRH